MDSEAMQAEIDDLTARLELVESLLWSLALKGYDPDTASDRGRYRAARVALGLDQCPPTIHAAVSLVRQARRIAELTMSSAVDAIRDIADGMPWVHRMARIEASFVRVHLIQAEAPPWRSVRLLWSRP